MRNLFITLSVSCISLAMLACNRSEPTPMPDNTVKPAQPPVANVDVGMSNAFIEGTVKSSLGDPLEGVLITSGESTTTSDKNGNFSFSRVADASGRFVLKFSKSGYFHVTRSGVINDNVTINVVMQSKGGANTASRQFNALESEVIEAQGMQVNIPARSLVTLDGREYSGTVQADMFYLSPDNNDFADMMPGSDLAAVRDDESEVTLISYGMVEVSLTDNGGNALQLKDGEHSEMTFPIPESMRDNPPQTIPLWYFDDNSGLWVEEGIATLQGDVYVGEVGHFSWHNLDVPAERVSISGKVTDCRNRPVSRVTVTVEQTSAVTNNDGTYTVYVPENTPVSVLVQSEDYFFYSPEVSVDVSGQPGGSVVRNVDLQLPCVPVISGRITDVNDMPVLSSIYCEYEANGVTCTSEVAYSSATTGEYVLRLPLNAYGLATFHIEPLGGDATSRVLELTGEDQTLDVKFESSVTPGDGSIVQIKGENGSTLLAAEINEQESYTMIADGTFAYMGALYGGNDTLFMVSIENYIETTTSYDTATVVLTGTINGVMHTFSAENSHLEILQQSAESISFTIIADGLYYSADGVESAATLSSTITCAVNKMDTEWRANVTEWSSLDSADIIPQLKTPIDLVAKVSYMGIDVEALYYHATQEEADAVCQIFTSNGWSLMDEQRDDMGYTLTYMSSATYSMANVQYNAQGLTAPDGNQYTLCVMAIALM